MLNPPQLTPTTPETAVRPATPPPPRARGLRQALASAALGLLLSAAPTAAADAPPAPAAEAKAAAAAEGNAAAAAEANAASAAEAKAAPAAGAAAEGNAAPAAGAKAAPTGPVYEADELPPGFERVSGAPPTEQVSASKLVVGAYAAFFLGMFGFVIYVARRQQRLAEELAELRARLPAPEDR